MLLYSHIFVEPSNATNTVKSKQLILGMNLVIIFVGMSTIGIFFSL